MVAASPLISMRLDQSGQRRRTKAVGIWRRYPTAKPDASKAAPDCSRFGHEDGRVDVAGASWLSEKASLAAIILCGHEDGATGRGREVESMLRGRSSATDGEFCHGRAAACLRTWYTAVDGCCDDAAST